MINRTNYQHVRAYLAHLEQRQRDPETISRSRSLLRHLLEWADETEFPRVRTLDPFPAYLVDTGLAAATLTKCLAVARQFFAFCRMEYPHLYKPVTDSWIESLQPPRNMRPEARLPDRTYYTLAEIKAIAALPVDTLHLQRAQAGACLLYLSGMRSSALASIPIHCVDLPNRSLMQLPEFGVRTKNHKAAITYLLPIPELLTVVEHWDALLKAAGLSPQALWYSTLDRFNERLVETCTPFKDRHTAVQKDLKRLCTQYGIPYLSPHKLRHGHVVYGVGRVKNLRELKSVSLNVMHRSVVTTDAVYSRLVGEEVREVISGLF